MLHAGRDQLVLRFDRAELTIHIVPPGAFIPRLVVPHRLRRPPRTNCAARADRWTDLHPDALIAAHGRARALSPKTTLRRARPGADPAGLREGRGEVEAAARRELPPLLAGRKSGVTCTCTPTGATDATRWMLCCCAAEALGFEYVAITDHSQTSAIARGLDVNRLERQMEAVAAAREARPASPSSMESEVDILPDGSLDFPECGPRAARRGACVIAT